MTKVGCAVDGFQLRIKATVEKHKEAEPRIGLAYDVKKTNTVLRVSYARVLETPFNENLVLSSQGCGNAVLAPLLATFADRYQVGWVLAVGYVAQGIGMGLTAILYWIALTSCGGDAVGANPSPTGATDAAQATPARTETPASDFTNEDNHKTNGAPQPA